MKMKQRSLLAPVLLGTVVAVGLDAAAANPTYRITDLGTLGGTYSIGMAINASGQVAGQSTTTNDEATHAFLWDGSAMRDLGTLGGTYAYARAINASGQVAGFSWTTGDATYHAFLWDGAAMRDLGTLGGTYSTALAMNSSGQVTGQAQLGGGDAHAFLWDGSAMRDLGTLGGADSMGWAVNDLGQVAGWAATADGSGHHAAVWDGAVARDVSIGGSGQHTAVADAINESGQASGWYAELEPGSPGRLFVFLWDGSSLSLGSLGGISQCNGYAINDAGLVTGDCRTDNNSDTHAFLFDGTTMRDLGTLGGTWAWGSDISDDGRIVGESYTAADAEFHPFLWDGTTMHDLNDLIDPTDPLRPYVTLVGSDATAMNERGQIVTGGIDSRTSQFHAYVLSPTSPMYVFQGFFSPVDNVPTRNVAKAGSAIPVKFSLGGNQGLDVFSGGSPYSQQINCDTGGPEDSVEETVNAGSSSLSYAAGADQYNYVWKTDKAWAGTCRQLTLRFDDGTEHGASFQFK